MCCTVVQAPKLYDTWLRDYVGSRVVKITNEANNSGGTGFHAELPSGQTVIITNKHVCEGVGKDSKVFVHPSLSDTFQISRKILYISPDTDVCVVEPMDGITGLKFAPKDLQAGEHVYVYGHPHLLPLTKSEGEILSEENVEVVAFYIHSAEDQKACTGRYYSKKVNFLFWQEEVCMSNYDSYITNLTIFPGNSGSPVVDSWGRVISIVYAGDNSTNWGIFLGNSELQQFLSHEPL